MAGEGLLGQDWGEGGGDRMGKTYFCIWWLDNEGQKGIAQSRKKGSPQLPSEDQSGAGSAHAPSPSSHPVFFKREETRDGCQLSPDHLDGDQILDL